MNGVQLRNWKGSIVYQAHSLEKVSSPQDIARIIQDKSNYPSPVRVKGSHHSTTRCVVADEGTVIDMSALNQIVEINKENLTITMQAGVLLIDAAKELEQKGLQFFVNIELGNLTMGSGACCATKDASYVSEDYGQEFGQVNSYVVAMKYVDANGELQQLTEADTELMEAMRSSYGMLGVVFEVTYKVKPIKPLAVKHIRYTVDEFANNLDELVQQNRSMMLYMFPFLNSLLVEYRYDGEGPINSGSWQWRLRNKTWSTLAPGFSHTLHIIIPLRRLRFWIIDCFNRAMQWIVTHFLRGRGTSPADQIIRYPEVGGYSAYTFSIWGFSRDSYGETIRAYFTFCQDHFKTTGFRCDLLNVGYYIAQDKSSLFSYTRDAASFTLDPVCTGTEMEGWRNFLVAYNEFCHQHGGKPLFNQTPLLTGDQAKAAFAEEIPRFLSIRQDLDPENRFYSKFFKTLFE